MAQQFKPQSHLFLKFIGLIVGISVVGCFGLAVLAILARNGIVLVPTPETQPLKVYGTPLAKMVAPATIDPLYAPPYSELCRRPPDMTDVQFQRHFEQFKGKKIVEWTGYVFDVYGSPGNYKLDVAMDAPRAILWTRDITIHDIPDDQAGSLSKKQKVMFSGTIQNIGLFLGAACNPINVEKAHVVVIP